MAAILNSGQRPKNIEEELKSVVAASLFNSDDVDDERRAEKAIFEALPEAEKRKLLLGAEKEDEPNPRLLLEAFRRFPDVVSANGGRYLASVLEKSRQRPQNADLRALIVLEVAPLMLNNKDEDFKVEVDVLKELLNVTVTFSWTLVRKSDSEGEWNKIFGFVTQIGRRLNWKMPCSSSGEDVVIAGDEDEAFFSLTLSFLRQLWRYNSELKSKRDEEENEDEFSPVLVEAFAIRDADDKKRPKTSVDEENGVELSGKAELKEAFLSSTILLERLTSSNSFWLRFQRLRPRNDEEFFFADVALYNGKFREALQLSSSSTSTWSCSRLFRLATTHFALGNRHEAANSIIQAVKKAPAKSTSPTTNLPLKMKTSRRHLHFLDVSSRSTLVEYAARVLVTVLQPIQAESDFALGHAIVLLQHFAFNDNTCEDDLELFFHLMHRIRMRDTFSYSPFSTFVVRIEVLEEFSALMSANPPARVVLDIGPQTSGASSLKPRVGTRGANRGEKEEIKTVLRKQAATRSNDDTEDVVVDFVDKCADSILHCLL